MSLTILPASDGLSGFEGVADLDLPAAGGFLFAGLVIFCVCFGFVKQQRHTGVRLRSSRPILALVVRLEPVEGVLSCVSCKSSRI